jgi:hypothetical protein
LQGLWTWTCSVYQWLVQIHVDFSNQTQPTTLRRFVEDGFNLQLSIHLQDSIETSQVVVIQMSHGTLKSLINLGPRMLYLIGFNMLGIFTHVSLRRQNLVRLAMIQYFSTIQILMMHFKISKTHSLLERQSKSPLHLLLMLPKSNPTSQMEIGWTWTIILTSKRLTIQVVEKWSPWLWTMSKTLP